MCSLFRDRFRVESTRLRGYDYSSSGKYFITICTKKNIHYFGEIENGSMMLSEIGKVADKFWQEIPNHFHNIILDEYVIMPNHIHGIIIVETTNLGVSTGSTQNNPVDVETPNLVVSTGSTQNNPVRVETPKLGVSTSTSPGSNYCKPYQIGLVINQYKRICTIKTKSSGFDFSWHPNYYDHIIRNQSELNRIREYIQKNPEKYDLSD